MKIQKLLSPEIFFKTARKASKWFWGFFILFAGYGLIAGLFIAPPDYQQGEAYRIIYIHVPLAFWSLGAYSVLTACSILSYLYQIKIADACAQTAAQLGAWFTALALITGAIWGKPMWGTWWIWDARLTSELLLLFIYWGYIGLRNSIPNAVQAKKVSQLFAIVGFINVPIIHFSVDWWQTLHQGATLSKFAKPSIDPSMLYPLLAMIVALSCYFAAMMCMLSAKRLIHDERAKAWAIKSIKELNAR